MLVIAVVDLHKNSQVVRQLLKVKRLIGKLQLNIPSHSVDRRRKSKMAERKANHYN